MYYFVTHIFTMKNHAQCTLPTKFDVAILCNFFSTLYKTVKKWVPHEIRKKQMAPKDSLL
jgi:hypothetical protein